MTEYWKSQARKYCDFCKCWLADNKVSISFHENGKRHKENVQKHISTLSKKSAKDMKQKEKMDDDIKRMEKAAMAAYMKDVQNNADLTSQSINNMLGRGSSSDTGESSTAASPHPAASPPARRQPPWHEVRGEGGNYYWNTDTNETTWDPPDEYLSLAQQEENKLKEKQLEKKKAKQEDKQKKQKHKDKLKEIEAHLAREKMRELSAQPLAPAAPVPAAGPAPRAAKPYGGWTAVVTQPTPEPVDLQLPKVSVWEPPVTLRPEERPQFTERVVTSLGDEPVAFKRRKVTTRNIRRKVDED